MSDDDEFAAYNCKTCGMDKLDCLCLTWRQRLYLWLEPKFARILEWIAP
jgi:hypothetical protein